MKTVTTQPAAAPTTKVVARPTRVTRARVARAAAVNAAAAAADAAKPKTVPAKAAAVSKKAAAAAAASVVVELSSSEDSPSSSSSSPSSPEVSGVVERGSTSSTTKTTTKSTTASSSTTSASTTAATSPSNVTHQMSSSAASSTSASTPPTTYAIIIPRQPPPIPTPPKPLDLDRLVARRVEAAASAGSASAPALDGEEDEEKEEEEEEEEVEEEVEEEEEEGEEEADETATETTTETTTEKDQDKDEEEEAMDQEENTTTEKTAAATTTTKKPTKKSKSKKKKRKRGAGDKLTCQKRQPDAISKLLENFIFVCPNCFGSFRSERDLAVHKYVVHQVASYICSHYEAGKGGGCDFITQEKDVHKRHEVMHVSPAAAAAHFCPICQEAADSEEALTTHITTRHGTFSCYVCGLVLPNRALHGSHMVSYHKEAALKCEVCTYKTYLKAPFERHVRQHRQYRQCTVEGCNEAFPNEKRLEEHMARLHRNVRAHRCERCAEEIGGGVGGISGTASAEGEEENGEETPPPAEVPTFYSLKKLQAHLVEVHGDSMLRCERCDFKAVNKRALVIHQRGGCRNHEARAFLCGESLPSDTEGGAGQLCQAAFSTEARLRAHQAARHSAEPRFPCLKEHCDRRFRSALQLSRHQREAHPPDLEVVDAAGAGAGDEEGGGGVGATLAYLNELIGGVGGGGGGGGGGSGGLFLPGTGGLSSAVAAAVGPCANAMGVGALHAKPFRCRSDGCGAHFGLRTELIKHERMCFFNKRRASAAAAPSVAASPSTSSRKSNAAAAASSSGGGKSRGRPKGSSSSSSSTPSTSGRPGRASKAGKSAASAAAAAAEQDEAATAIDSLMMIGSGGGGEASTSSQGGGGGELITTEVISLPMEHLGEHQYITRY